MMILRFFEYYVRTKLCLPTSPVHPSVVPLTNLYLNTNFKNNFLLKVLKAVLILKSPKHYFYVEADAFSKNHLVFKNILGFLALPYRPSFPVVETDAFTETHLVVKNILGFPALPYSPAFLVYQPALYCRLYGYNIYCTSVRI